MEPISHLVKVSFPAYLESLPIPDSFGGWFKLGFRDWLSLIPPAAATAGLYYITYKAFCPKAREGCGKGQINPIIKKDVPKVVDWVDIEDITEKTKFCRCWKSKTWPYCDGAHMPHNEETGDNVGPVILDYLKKKETPK